MTRNEGTNNRQSATKTGVQPGNFPLGSEHSRAAARALLSAKAEQPRQTLRILLTASWETIPGKEGTYRMPELDLAKSTCKRTLSQDGTLLEFIGFHGNPHGLNDAELENWIATFPINGR